MRWYRTCRRVGVGIVTLAVVAACSSSPKSFSQVGTMSVTDRWTCAMQEVNELGYTVADANKESGLIRAQKESSGLINEAISGTHNFRVLSVSIYEQTESDNTQMRITASQREQSIMGGFLGGGEESGQAPDDETKKAAKQILETCAGSDSGNVETPSDADGNGDGSGGPVTYSIG